MQAPPEHVLDLDNNNIDNDDNDDNDNHDENNDNDDNDGDPRAGTANIYALQDILLNQPQPRGHHHLHPGHHLHRAATRVRWFSCQSLLRRLALFVAIFVFAHAAAIYYVHNHLPGPFSRAPRYIDSQFAAGLILSYSASLRNVGAHLPCLAEQSHRARTTYRFPHGHRHADELLDLHDAIDWPLVTQLVLQQSDESLGLAQVLATLNATVESQEWHLHRHWYSTRPWRLAWQMMRAKLAPVWCWLLRGRIIRGLPFIADFACDRGQVPGSWAALHAWDVAEHPHRHPALFLPVCETAAVTAISLRESRAIILNVRATVTGQSHHHSPRRDLRRRLQSLLADVSRQLVHLEVATAGTNMHTNMSTGMKMNMNTNTGIRHMGPSYAENVRICRAWEKPGYFSSYPVTLMEVYVHALFMHRVRLRDKDGKLPIQVVELWLDMRQLFGAIVSDMDAYATASDHLAQDLLNMLAELLAAMLAYGCPRETTARIFANATSYPISEAHAHAQDHPAFTTLASPGPHPQPRAAHDHFHFPRTDAELQRLWERHQIRPLRFTPNHLDLMDILARIADTVVVPDLRMLSANSLAVVAEDGAGVRTGRSGGRSPGGGGDGSGKAGGEHKEERKVCPHVTVVEVAGAKGRCVI